MKRKSKPKIKNVELLLKFLKVNPKNNTANGYVNRKEN
jgi:hypothetical protein